MNTPTEKISRSTQQKTPDQSQDKLNECFIDSKDDSNVPGPSQERPETQAQISKEIKSAIIADNEEEAWENYLELYHALKAREAFEAKLEAFLAENNYDEAILVQHEIEKIDAKKNELQKKATQSFPYLKGSKDEMKKQYVEYLRKQIWRLENEIPDKDEVEMEIIKAQLGKYHKKLSACFLF